MARTPRASVSKTSGQGVSRYSYQKARALAGGTPQIKGISSESSGRDYSKHKAFKPDEASGFNVSYGDTYVPTDLDEIKELGERKPPKSWNHDRKTAKKLK